MDIGSDLRRARTARNLSIAEIARRTKISPSVLRAIEDRRFDCVPGGLFARAFLRTYAREVGLDPESIVERYRAEFETPAVAPEPNDPKLAIDARVDSIAAANEPRGSSQALGLAVVLLIGLAYFGFTRMSPSPGSADPKGTGVLEASAPASPIATVPVATAGSIGARAEATSGAPLKLEIQAIGPCWVAVTADGERVISRLLNAGERQQLDMREQVTMRVGDPGAFTFTINGAAGKPLGPAGTPSNAQITRQNYVTFLASR